MSSDATGEIARFATASHTLAANLYSGRHVLVSGGGSGIGQAIAWLMARLGGQVTICGRSAERLEAAVAAMAEHGLTAWAQTCDIRNEGAVSKLLNGATSRFGELDLLVNNAGGQFPSDAIDISPKGWRTVVDLNLTGTWLMMQAAARRWISAGRGGSIVNIVASCERGMPGIAHSSAARAGVINASRTAAVEWAPAGVRVNCLAPGVVETRGLEVYPPHARAKFRNANPQKALGDPWDIAQMVAFLGCDAARFMTGETVVVDGGGALWGDLWTQGQPDYFASPSVPWEVSGEG
jgi:citronellol/citronellal dehydrogenase